MKSKLDFYVSFLSQLSIVPFLELQPDQSTSQTSQATRSLSIEVMPAPVAVRSKAQVFGRSPAQNVGSNPNGGMDVCLFFECCVLSGRGLCDGLITRPEESYRLWRVVVCDQETSKTKGLNPATGLWKIQPQWVLTPRKQTNNTNKQLK